MQESQLEFAHKQLDARLQEMRGQVDAAATADRAADVLQAQLAATKDEVISARREVEAGETRGTQHAPLDRAASHGRHNRHYGAVQVQPENFFSLACFDTCCLQWLEAAITFDCVCL